MSDMLVYEMRLIQPADLIRSIVSDDPRDLMFARAVATSIAPLVRGEKTCFVCDGVMGFPNTIVVCAPRENETEHPAGVGAICNKCAAQPHGKVVEDVVDAAEQLWGFKIAAVERTKC